MARAVWLNHVARGLAARIGKARRASGAPPAETYEREEGRGLGKGANRPRPRPSLGFGPGFANPCSFNWRVKPRRWPGWWLRRTRRRPRIGRLLARSDRAAPQQWPGRGGYVGGMGPRSGESALRLGQCSGMTLTRTVSGAVCRPAEREPRSSARASRRSL